LLSSSSPGIADVEQVSVCSLPEGVVVYVSALSAGSLVVAG